MDDDVELDDCDNGLHCACYVGGSSCCECGAVLDVVDEPEVTRAFDTSPAGLLRIVADELRRARSDMLDAAAQLEEIGGDGRDVGRQLRRRAVECELRLLKWAFRF